MRISRQTKKGKGRHYTLKQDCETCNNLPIKAFFGDSDWLLLKLRCIIHHIIANNLKGHIKYRSVCLYHTLTNLCIAFYCITRVMNFWGEEGRLLKFTRGGSFHFLPKNMRGLCMHYSPKSITVDLIKLQFVIMIFPFHSSPPPPPAPTTLFNSWPVPKKLFRFIPSSDQIHKCRARYLNEPKKGGIQDIEKN